MNQKQLRRVLVVMLLGVLVYGAYAVLSGVGRFRDALTTFSWGYFALAVAFAAGNYVCRFFKWEIYLAVLGIRGVGKVDSFLTFLSGFVLTITPGKVGEVFKSLVLAETHGVAIARTAPIVVAERVTDLIGIIVLIVVGSLGFTGGLVWAGLGATLVTTLLVIVASRRLSLGIIALLERGPGPLRAIGPRLHEAYESLSLLVAPRNLAVPTLLSILAWFLECLSLWSVLQGFSQTTGVALCTFFYATSTLAGALVPTPGGLGVTETALQQQMSQLGGVPVGVSTAAMMLVRLATLWFAVLVGFVALSALKRRHPGLLAGGVNAPRPERAAT